MEMHMRLQTGAKAVNKGHSADAQTCRVDLCHACTVFMQAVLDDAQEHRNRCRAVLSVAPSRCMK